jgi:hypothetical protein
MSTLTYVHGAIGACDLLNERLSCYELSVLEWCEISSDLYEQFVDGMDHFLLCSLQMQSVVLCN